VNPRLKSALLAAEFVALFLCLPLLLFFTGTRLGIYAALWGAGLYAFWMLRRAPDFSWRKLWHGDGWSPAAQRFALLRFLFLAALLTLATVLLVPERLMRFPLDRFPLWLAVMVLYPLLSIVPQELFFRSFYFARYRGAVAEPPFGFFINGLLFGFGHIVLNNWIAPTFCAVGGMIFAHSYQQHRSLKWAVVEHSLYGCWVFTVGIGWYFFTGNWRP
jgi:hypothetical protein